MAQTASQAAVYAKGLNFEKKKKFLICVQNTPHLFDKDQSVCVHGSQ
jgi:hypothetical protein